jgi:hypothetical protein
MERRARARLMAAALQSGRIAARQRLVRGESADRLRHVAAARRLSAFSCSVEAARDAFVRSVHAFLSAEEQVAAAARANASDMLLPWARLRIGLERLQARRAGANPR